MGITHLKSPIYHPQSNGPTENAVKRVKTKFKQLEAEDPEVRLLQALYALRATPMADGPKEI